MISTIIWCLETFRIPMNINESWKTKWQEFDGIQIFGLPFFVGSRLPIRIASFKSQARNVHWEKQIEFVDAKLDTKPTCKSRYNMRWWHKDCAGWQRSKMFVPSHRHHRHHFSQFLWSLVVWGLFGRAFPDRFQVALSSNSIFQLHIVVSLSISDSDQFSETSQLLCSEVRWSLRSWRVPRPIAYIYICICICIYIYILNWKQSSRTPNADEDSLHQKKPLQGAKSTENVLSPKRQQETKKKTRNPLKSKNI